MLNMIKQKWIEWLVGLVLIIIASLLTQQFTVKNEAKSSIQQQIDKKADMEYVDKQDANIRYQLRQHENNQVELIKQMDQKYESIDHKLDILIGKKQ
jgi:uncharacterized membrane-anchored protein YhcB (DUF1043 family)